MPTQEIVHYHPARFRIDVRGRRSGKSFGAGREGASNAMTPGSKGCILAPTYDLADKTMREIDYILFQKLGVPTYYKQKIRGSLRYAKLKLGPREYNSSEIWVRSADNPDSILGEGYDWAIVDEAARISRVVIEQYFRPTLSERKGSVLYITTPNGFNWLYDFFVRGQSKEEIWNEWMSWQHPTTTSKYVPPEEIEAAKSEMSIQFFKQEYMADFMSFAGQVYGDFNRQIHAKYNISYDKSCPLYCCIDFGYRMPAVVWAQVVPGQTGNKLVFIDSILHREYISTPQLKKMIIEKNRQKGYQVEEYFCDPAGKQMQSSSGTNDIDVFLQRQDTYDESIVLKYRTDKAATNVNNGIKLVRALIYNAHGVISLYVSNTQQELISDFEGYAYPKKKTEEAASPPEIPFKDGKYEHGMDVVRLMAVNLAHYFKNYVYVKELVH